MKKLSMAVCVALLCAACGDDSSSNNNDNTNNQNVPGSCGDGVQDPGEACDDGAQNSDTAPDACRTNCRLPYCGDGVADAGEECDEGAQNSDSEPDACRTDCRAASCQDGVLDDGEGCDDGNDVAGDGCAPSCTVEARWECAGSPSLCSCADYYLGPSCTGCAVRVKSDVFGVIPDGATWETAFSTVQEGIELAEQLGGGCEVWVAGGTYYIYESSVGDTVQVRTGVGLYGGFAGTETTREQRDWEANPTVLDGMREGSSLLDADFVTHVVTAVDTTDATLDGFVVTGGWAQENAPPYGDSGGGLFVAKVIGSSEMTVANCTFTVNTANEYGGAIAVDGGTLRISASTIVGNNAAWGGAISGRNLAVISVEGSTISLNAATDHGGGIYSPYGDLTVLSTAFYGNYVHGMGGQGGGLYGSTATILRNATLVDNAASGTGSAVYQAAEATNCIFQGNSGTSVSAVTSVTYSQVQSTRAGAGNSTGAPQLVALPELVTPEVMQGATMLTGMSAGQFQVGDVIEIAGDGVMRTVTDIPSYVVFDPPITRYHYGLVLVEIWGVGATSTTEDLRLQPTSPCIDTADDTAAPPLDHDGNPRVDVTGVGTAGTLADRGAYEYQP